MITIQILNAGEEQRDQNAISNIAQSHKPPLDLEWLHKQPTSKACACWYGSISQYYEAAFDCLDQACSQYKTYREV